MDPTTETALTSATTPITRPSQTETQDEIDVDAIVLRNDLRLYIREAWHVVEPATVYLENWHIDLIAEHPEASQSAQIKRLFISMLQLVSRAGPRPNCPRFRYLQFSNKELIHSLIIGVVYNIGSTNDARQSDLDYHVFRRGPRK
jgi:hypothetical protein